MKRFLDFRVLIAKSTFIVVIFTITFRDAENV